MHCNYWNVTLVYMDLLAVTATSSKLAFKITLKNDEDCERLKMFITDKLKFNQVGEHKSQPTMVLKSCRLKHYESIL